MIQDFTTNWEHDVNEQRTKQRKSYFMLYTDGNVDFLKENVIYSVFNKNDMFDFRIDTHINDQLAKSGSAFIIGGVSFKVSCLDSHQALALSR